MTLEHRFNQTLTLDPLEKEKGTERVPSPLPTTLATRRGQNHHLPQIPFNSELFSPQQSPSTMSPSSPSAGGDEQSFSPVSKKISFGKVYGGKSSGKTKGTEKLNLHDATKHNSNNNNNESNKATTPTSPNMGRSRHPSSGDKDVRVTRKVFNTWRSVCGKKTKGLFKRWKAVPEDKEKETSVGNANNEDGERERLDSGGSTSSHPRNGSVTSVLPSKKALDASTLSVTPSSVPTTTVDKIKMFVKKRSQTEITEDDGEHKDRDVSGNRQWSVHVWATYVQREDEEEEVEKPAGRDYLSDFQKAKLTHFFSYVLDMNHDNVISAADFVALNQRIRHYIEWSSDCIEFHILKEVHSGFLECFLNQPLDEGSSMYYCSGNEIRSHVDTDEWLDIWGELLHGKMMLENLPLWLQYFPKIIFQVINRSGSGTISKEELRAFYTSFLGIDFRVVNETLDMIYNSMTDKSSDGFSPITYSLFKLSFANFLFGKHPHGPGQYLFGICSKDTIDCMFPIDYSTMNTDKDDLEPYQMGNKVVSNRRSVIV